VAAVMFRLGGVLGSVICHRFMPRLPLAPVLASRGSLRFAPST
jgi:hypothetical protein